MTKLKPISYKLKAQQGFVALMSAIIISVVLLLLVTNLSLTGFYDRSNILDGELKEVSSGYAEACVDTALLMLANNNPPPNGYSVNVDGVGGNDCIINSVSGSIIKVQGNYNTQYFTNLKVVFNPNDLSIVSWEEI